MEFRGARRRGSVRSARVLDPRRWFAALNRKLRPRHNTAEAWRARLAELTASWGEPAREWSATPVDTEEPLTYVRLGGPALPLIRRFAEPALQVEVHVDIVVARFQT